MKLSEYAESTEYEQLSDGDPRLISLGCSLEEFLDLEPVQSKNYPDSTQYEIPIRVWNTELSKSRDSCIATRSKRLVGHLLEAWEKNSEAILRVHCSGSGFRATFTVEEVKTKSKRKKSS